MILITSRLGFDHLFVLLAILLLANWLLKVVFGSGVLKIAGYFFRFICSLFSKKHSKKQTTEAIKLQEQDLANYPYFYPLYTNQEYTNYYAINNPFRGVLIVGGAGSGKTHTFIKGIIERSFDLGFSGIIYDYKYPSLSKIWHNLDKEYGDNIITKNYVINFEEPEQSHRVNPLHPSYLKSVAYAEEYATAILNNLMPETIKKPDFWSRSAIALLQAAIWYFKEHHPEKCNLPNVVTFLLCIVAYMKENNVKDIIMPENDQVGSVQYFGLI